MSGYRLSEKADDDLHDIYVYSYRQFGESAADAYLLGLHSRFLELAAWPEHGSRADTIRAGYRQSSYESHSIFYRVEKGGILIVRVLHQKMETLRHLR